MSKKKKNLSEVPNDGNTLAGPSLRQKAEEAVKKRHAATPLPLAADAGHSRSEADTMKLLHELEVQQVELAMQNEELELALSEATTAVNKYTELYDFAPAGYFTLSREGVITELNLSGARMLGKERSRLISKIFRQFVARETLPVMNNFLQSVFNTNAKQTCVVKLAIEGNPVNYIHLEGLVSEDEKKCLVSAVDITDRKQAEQALRIEEARFRAITTSAQDAILIINPEGNIFFSNPASERVFGYSGEEMAGKNLHLLLSPQRYHASHLEAFARFRKTGQGDAVEKNLELEARCKDGREIAIELSLSALELPDGWYAVGIIRDITESRKAKDALRENEAFLNSLLNAIPIPVFYKDRKGEYLGFNKAYETFFGKTREELIGKTVFDISPPELAGIYHVKDSELIERGGSQQYDSQVENAYGQLRDVIFNKAVYTDSQGTVSGLIGAILDITDRKQFEKALAHLGMQNQLILNSAAEGILGLDMQGNLVFTNPAAVSMLGYTAGEIEGQNSHSLWHHTKQDGTPYYQEECPIYATLCDGAVHRVSSEVFWRKDGASFPVEYSSTPMYEQGRIVGAVVIFIDITERRQMEKELKISYNRFQNAMDAGNIAWWEMDCLSGAVIFHENKALMLGFAPEQFSHYADFTRLIHPEDYEPVMQIMRDHIEGKTPRYDTMYRIKTASGYYRWFRDLGGISEYNDAGKPQKITGIVIDISDLKLAEEKLKSSEIQYRRLFEAARDGILILDATTGQIVDVNPFLIQMLGYSFAELSGKELWEIGTFKNIAASKDAFIELQKKEYIRFDDMPLETKQGKKIAVEFVSNVYLVNQKKVIQCNIRDITDRSRAQEALRISEARLKSVIEGTNVGTWEWNVLTGESVFNERWAEIIGYSLAELSPVSIATWLEKVHPDDLKESEMQLESVFAHKRSLYDIECRMKHRNGSWIWIHDRGKVIEWTGDGKAKRMVGTHMDITERRHIQEKIRNAGLYNRSLIDASLDPFIITSPDGKITDVNISAENATGFGRTELIGTDFSDYFTNAEKVRGVHQQVFKKGFVRDFQLEIRHRDGHLISVLYNASVYLDEAGSIAGVFATARDITERRQAEERIRYFSAIHNLIMDNSTLGISLVRNRAFEWVNSRLGEMLMLPPGQLQGSSSRIIYPSDKAYDEIGETAYPVLSRGERSDTIVMLKRSDGTLFWCRFIGKALNPEKPHEGSIWMFEDITDRKQTEDKLKESEMRLRELNATKDKFFTIIAHDLKGPFNNIVGLSNLLADQIRQKDYKGIEDFTGFIQVASQRAMDLLVNLLEWSRSQTGRMKFKPEIIEIGPLITEVTELLNYTARQKSISIFRELPGNVNVFADKAMVSAILRNLISNAVKFSKPGGEIVVSAEQQPGGLLVTVSDNGVGINKEAIEKLFRIEESFSTKGTRDESGTGLGLLLCREFVEKHSGKIWVESEVGKGSKFYFTIPETHRNTLSPQGENG